MLDQSNRDFELIIVDDGSTDCTPDIGTWYAKEDSRVQYVRFNDRAGAARCRNHGNRIACGMWIKTADAGDIYHRDCSKVLLKRAEQGDVDVVYSSVAMIDAVGKAFAGQEAIPYKAGEKINFSHPTVAYSYKVATTHSYRETSKETDQYEAFFLELALMGKRFGYVTNTLVLKRQMSDLPGSRDLVEARKMKREIYREFNLEWPFEEPDGVVQVA